LACTDYPTRSNPEHKQLTQQLLSGKCQVLGRNSVEKVHPIESTERLKAGCPAETGPERAGTARVKPEVGFVSRKELGKAVSARQGAETGCIEPKQAVRTRLPARGQRGAALGSFEKCLPKPDHRLPSTAKQMWRTRHSCRAPFVSTAFALTRQCVSPRCFSALEAPAGVIAAPIREAVRTFRGRPACGRGQA